MYLPEQRSSLGFPIMRRFAATTLAIAAAALTPALNQANVAEGSTVDISHAELNPNDTIENIIGDVTKADGFAYGVRDNNGNSMDTLKIINNPNGGYLGIYHVGNTVRIATGDDLEKWRERVVLDEAASQPTIFLLEDKGYLTVVEFNQYVNGSPTGAKLRIRYFPDTEALLNNQSTKQKTIRRRLSLCNEGTPAVRSYEGKNIGRSVITLTFHYQKNCKGDRQAIGTLTNFKKWTAKPDKKLDKTLLTKVGESAAILDGLLSPIVPGRGSVGDRDHFIYRGTPYSMYEAQSITGDFSTWRTFLYNQATNQTTYIQLNTHGGSKANANPTFSEVTLPSGEPGIVMTRFIPQQGSAPGEAGTVVYYRKINKAS